jgi:enoyl-CoA hydratase/carnithine racemase
VHPAGKVTVGSKNALHGPLRAALRAAMGAADHDDDVAAVVLE